MTTNKSAFGRSVMLIVSIAALAGFLFGYDSAVINGATEAIRTQFNASSGILGFAVASALVGAAVGAFFGGNLADKHGRVLVMKIAAALFLISAVGSAFAPEIISLVVFRVVGGVGMGIASIIAPAYIAEIAPTRVRGRLGSMQQFAIVVGIFFSQLVNKLIADGAGSSSAEWLWGIEAWRWMLLVEALPAAAYLVGAYLIPESPRYLVSLGKRAEAHKVLSLALAPAEADAALARIEQTLRTDRKPRFSDIRGKAAGLKPVIWVGILLALFQQLVGINVVFYYSNTLWQSVGFDESQSFIFSLISAAINVTVTIIAIMLVDKVGRKPLLLIGSIGMAVTLGVMSFIFATATVGANGPVLEGAAGPIALVSANLFVVFFGVSWGPVMWVMLGEMFPNKIRGAALAVAGFVQWFANFMVTQTFPPLADFSLGLAYGLYATFALVSFFLVLKFVRETRGVDLEDMVE